MTRTFLALVGVAYLALALWCALAPKATARFVGYELRPGAGQSEYLTVYGGLQVALAILFLWPAFQPATQAQALFACAIVHGALVVFRTIGFVAYTAIPNSTRMLAATEWLILLASLFLMWRRDR